MLTDDAEIGDVLAYVNSRPTGMREPR